MKRGLQFIAAVAGLLMLFFSPVKAEEEKKGNSRWFEREITMQNFRPMDQRGINMFEAPKKTDVPYEGFKLDWNAAFSGSFQAYSHKNDANPNMSGGIDLNKLMKMGPGFNTPNANLYLSGQLADGIRLQLSMYLSSRHHNETWVKDGYLLIDKLPFENPYLDLLMEMVTIKVGHFEINYGDSHFRRSDNGMALYNPFVGNYILDSFTTEIGGEVYIRPHGTLEGLSLMAGVTNGEIKGDVLTPAKGSRYPSILGKIGYDVQLTPDLRLRLTGSHYYNSSSPANTLFTGDRAGSRYFFVMENSKATTTAQFRSGGLDPGFSNKVRATQINPFVKYKGLEFFGVLEFASGHNAVETKDRSLRQYAADVIYRFLKDESAYVGARYNRVTGQLVAGNRDDMSIDKFAFGAGYFLTKNILLKGEYTLQNYKGFPEKDIRHGGSFKGVAVEAAIGF